MKKIKGTLIPIGGNEDKGRDDNEAYSLDFIDEGILSHVVREAGGEEANIIVIPTASSIPLEVYDNYHFAFEKLGCRHVQILDIRSDKHANSKSSLKLVKEASCVMFSGGNQALIGSKIGGTPLHDLLLQKYYNDDSFVIAGTSAGAMAMSEEMIIGGSATESFVKGAVRMSKGLGLLPNTIIDTHFIQRGRFGRITEAVAKFPSHIGFGFAEDTGMIIKNGRQGTVIGSGMVIVFDGSSLTHNNENVLENGTPMSMTDMKVHVLSNGDAIDLRTKMVAVLPIEAPFI